MWPAAQIPVPLLLEAVLVVLFGVPAAVEEEMPLKRPKEGISVGGRRGICVVMESASEGLPSSLSEESRLSPSSDASAWLRLELELWPSREWSSSWPQWRRRPLLP